MSAAPPPLKKVPPPRKKRDKAEAAPTPPPRGDDVELSSPALAARPDDDDATKGEWLFKQNDMVLGPVNAMVLVDRIKQGDLSADTPIARDGQPFSPMKLVALFREAYEATLEKKRREEEEREFNSKVKRSRMARVAVILVMVSAPAAAAGFGGHTLVKLQPWDKTAAWIARPPPLVDLPPRPIEVKKEEPKVAALAAETPQEPQPGDAPDRPGSGRRVARGDRSDKGDRGDKSDKSAKEPDEPKQTGPLPESLTNEQAIAPLKNAKDDLKVCFKAELDSNPDVPSPVILSYTVTEEGKAANVNLDNRELRGRPVVECVRKALTGLRWPRFTGERKNVSVPFKLSKPPKPGEPPK